MDQARFVSKLVERSLFDYYSQGVLIPHIFPLRRIPSGMGHRYVDVEEDPLPDDDQGLIEEHVAEDNAALEGLDASSLRADVRRYWSWPDTEGIISATNAIQSDHNLNDFMSQFKANVYKDGEREVTIRVAKITYPHVDLARKHDIPAPHPSMTDEELRRYVWPTSYLNRENTSYVGSLWIDIGEDDVEFTEQNEYGVYDMRTTNNSSWRRVMDIPIQVGSNRCNLAIMRSYLGDQTYDERHEMTWGERARLFLEGYIDPNIKWEPLVPDGYFIIKGKMKRVNISDKLMMNMAYVVKQSTAAEFGTRKIVPIRERTVEVRSVRTELGLAYLRILLVAPGRDELKPAKGMDNEIFKFYNATLRVMIDKEFPDPVNLFDLIRGYGVIVLGMIDTSRPMNDLLDRIREYSRDDREIMRMAMVTMAKAGSLDVQAVINNYRFLMLPGENRTISEASASNRELANKMRRKLLPHCEIGNIHDPTVEDLQAAYEAKIRFLAMMVVELGLSVTMKTGIKEYRKEPTDRKDFAYKRWEAAGHRLKDHIRSMFLPRTLHKGRGERYYGTIPLSNMNKASGQLADFMNQNKWPAKYRVGGTFKARKDETKDGIVDDVPKYNLISMLDSYRTVKISAKGGPNTSSIRRVHTSQWGQQCPANTPENANIGLNNNMAEACLITHDLTTLERNQLEEVINSLESLPFNPDNPSEGGYLLMVDGNPRGYYHPRSYDTLLLERRIGNINRGIGIARHYLWSKELSPGLPVIVVRTSHGRPIFPVFILDQDPNKLDRILNLTERDMREQGSYRHPIEYLMAEGLIEFIDAYELVYNVVVAPWIETAREEYLETQKVKYTHAMIKPGHILSQASNCLSFIEHNPAARGTYATQHIKQAIGRPFLHPEDRYDHETNYLHNPEPPLLMTDTLRRILYPPVEYRPLRPGSTTETYIHPRDIGIGRNVNIICMSFDGNNDDGLIVSESLVRSGFFDGEHFNITTSDKSILPSSVEAYDWVIDENTNLDIKDARGQGIPDPNFSASIVVPYGDPYIVEVTEGQFATLTPIDLQQLNPDATRSLGYELRPGEIYVQYGFYSAYILTYRDDRTGETSEVVIIPGQGMINLPGKTIVAREKGQVIRRMALAYVRGDRIEEYKRGSLNREHRPSIMSYDTLQTNPGIIDTRFLDRTPFFTVYDDDTTGISLPEGVYGDGDQNVDLSSLWYRSSTAPIPRTQLPGMNIPTRTGRPVTIRPRRAVQRGDVAIKIIRRRDGTPDSEVIDPKGERERFEITYGVVDGIERGTPMKIRASMPIGITPGNKYAVLYAQKSIIARIARDDEMPKARWYNQVSGRWEEMTFDVVFNPLSFPSRMTIGMEYEIFISGTLNYLYNIRVEDTTLGFLYRNNRERFNSYMSTYRTIHARGRDIPINADLIDELSDSTCFIYDNEEKYLMCRELRIALGIPPTGLYDVYLREEESSSYPTRSVSDTVMEQVVKDLPSHAEWTRRIETPIVCGTVYYVALRHLVDNKRRARGYVGRRDPLTLQPVKGRRRNGGANTGTMEADAYKAHGAGGMLLERLSRVSDYRQFLKCSICNGLVSRIGTNNTLRCNDCTAVLRPEEVIEHDTVNSWNLFRHYVRALGIEIYEEFS